MKNTYTRRRFLKNTSFGAAGLMLSNPIFAQLDKLIIVNGQGVHPSPMVTISLLEDASLLALRTGGFSGQAEAGLVSDLHASPASPANKGRIISTLPPYDRRLIELLSALVQKKDSKYFAEKVAICYGWTCKNVIAAQFAKMYRNFAPGEIEEMQLYQDAWLIKQYITHEAEAKEEELLLMLRTILPRAIVRVHTLKPDEDGPDWVNRISKLRRKMDRYLRTISEFGINPNHAKLKRYVFEPGFYNKDDLLIRYAKALRKGDNISVSEILKAVNTTGKSSIYARTLSDTIRNFMLISAILEGKKSLKIEQTKLLVRNKRRVYGNEN